MELRQLCFFVAVAEELHFNRAAARMCIAQPALSAHIQALEKELGVRLLERSTRRVELTRAGAVFYDRAVRIIGDVGLSAEVARSVAGKAARTIKIGTAIRQRSACCRRFFLVLGGSSQRSRCM